MSEVARSDDDRGMAMIAAVVIAMVGLLLMTTILAQGIHLADATAKDRQRVTALHVAETGVERAIVELLADPDYTGTGGTPEVTPEGEFVSTVIHCTALGVPDAVCPAKSHIIIDSTGTVGATNRERKRIQVTLGPEPSFKYALFSEDSLDLKNGSEIIGDIFSNNNIEVRLNNVIEGDVISSGGVVVVDKSEVCEARNWELAAPGADLCEAGAPLLSGGGGGSIYSGGCFGDDDHNSFEAYNTVAQNGDGDCTDSGEGWGINFTHSGASLEKHAEARRDCPAPSGQTVGGTLYRIQGTATVSGNSVAFGSISYNGGGTETTICKQRFGDRALPPYTFSRELYENAYGVGSVIEYDSVAEFETWLNADNASGDPNVDNLVGVHYVWEGDTDDVCDDVIDDFNGATIVGDFVLVTNCRIDAKNNLTVDAPSASTVNIISLNDSVEPAAIDIKNDLDVVKEDPEDPADADTDDAPVVLLYSAGLIKIKNTAVSTGAVYGGEIDIFNGMNIVYDARVERTIGFGGASLTRLSWREVPPV